MSNLSDYVEMIERGTVPVWLREEIVAKREEIIAALQSGGEITLRGPDGERVTIAALK